MRKPTKCSQCGRTEKAYYRVDSTDKWVCAECYLLAGCRYWPEKLYVDTGKIVKLMDNTVVDKIEKQLN